MRSPTKAQIADRAIAIARNEGLHVDTNAGDALVEQVKV
jgi:hypothetical protein